MNLKIKKRVKVVSTMALAIALLIGGSLAWRDITQQKTNKFRTKSISQSVVLIENFKDVDGWSINDAPVVKEVSVRNGHETDDPTKYTYSDGYVRLQLREFMGISDAEIVYSDTRYMIDANGNFIRGIDEAEALAAAKLVDDRIDSSRLRKAKSYTDDVAYFYVETQEGDVNGVYGKFLTLDIKTADTLKSIVDGSEVSLDELDSSQNIANNHNNNNALEGNVEDSDVYTTHTWENGDAPFTPVASKFAEYVEWKLGDHVITIDEWEALDFEPIAKWIVDTNSEEGWVYWGQALRHNTIGNVANGSLTEKLLESVKLIKQPEGIAEYRIHVNMDAVSLDDISSEWTDAPLEVINAFESLTEKESLRVQLQNLVNTATEIDQSLLNDEEKLHLGDLINLANVMLDNPNVPNADIKDVIQYLQNFIDLVGNINPLTPLINELAELVDEAKKIDLSNMTTETATMLENTISDSEAVLLNPNATELDLNNMIASLQAAINGLKEKPIIDVPKQDIGGKFTMQGINWTIIAQENGKSLVIVDELTDAQFELMKVTANLSDGLVKYHNSGNTYGSGYKGSKIEQVDVAFYDTFIKGSVVEQFVQKVDWVEESGTSNWNTKTNGVTVISENGSKKAFSLSVSDINVKDILNSGLDVGYGFWLRSPGSDGSSAAGLHSSLGIQSYVVNTNMKVRPALWIELGQ